MIVSKEDSQRMAKLDRRELEFFDRLGFTIEPAHTKVLGQEITDWYGTDYE
jgi:hypothetical protein